MRVFVAGATGVIGSQLVPVVSVWMLDVAKATAGGAILAMIASTMMPEAYEEAHEYTGMITALGFLVAFVLSKLES